MSSEKFLVLKALFKTKREKNTKVPVTPVTNKEEIKNQEISEETISNEIKNTNSDNPC